MTEQIASGAAGKVYNACPKCGHTPLPTQQSAPVACPGCGVIFAKIGQKPARGRRIVVEERWTEALNHVPERVDCTAFWSRCVLLAALAIWALVLIRLDYRVGEIGESFLHRPLLVFHEAGHVVFMPFGEWMTILGGTLGQLLMPLVMAGALLFARQDPFGASVGTWFLGVSLLDVAPYMVDALHPQLMLLSGTTGEEGGHDWIYLFDSMGLLARAQAIGGVTHKLGALVILASLAWGAWVLRRQYPRLAGDVLHEE